MLKEVTEGYLPLTVWASMIDSLKLNLNHVISILDAEREISHSRVAGGGN